MKTIAVSGYLVRFPMAGNVWAQLPYLIGLSRLGHDVWFVEDAGWPDSCYDPSSGQSTSSPQAGLDIVLPALARYGLGDRVAFRDVDGRWHGPAADAAPGIVRSADLYLDVGGTGHFEEMSEAKTTALVDMDPVFTQFGAFGHQQLDAFDHHFTYGLNVGSPSSPVPTLGPTWRPLPPPVLEDAWGPVAPTDETAPWTTVASWKTLDDFERDGVTYGHKDVEFMRIVDLPRRVPVALQVAINGGNAPRDELRENGWDVRDAGDVSKDLPTYETYVKTSRGEFSVAKNAYVVGRSGWFSDRTATYLAAGRPAVVQETGISHVLPTGEGLLTFRDADEAVAALKTVESDWSQHSEAAVAFAREHLAAEVVLGRLLEAVGL